MERRRGDRSLPWRHRSGFNATGDIERLGIDGEAQDAMTYSGLTPEDLARRVGRSSMRIRKLLRQMYPDLAPGSGTHWELTEAQVQAVLGY
jgi:hypothetical protein